MVRFSKIVECSGGRRNRERYNGRIERVREEAIWGRIRAAASFFWNSSC
jgi:3-mercaptopyruvate sulfurtransferase SseA